MYKGFEIVHLKRQKKKRKRKYLRFESFGFVVWFTGAVQCSQCKGNGVNSVDVFNGQFKAGDSCWLCGYLNKPFHSISHTF